MKSTLGVILLLLAVYLFLANFSYLLTWQQDQNRVMSRSLFDVLFDGNEEPVANWLGKFGAWSSHLLIYRWFGLASFAIPLISFVIGFKMLFNIAILPVAKTISASILSIVWFSLFFGFFSKQVSYAGGAFGYQVNDWLKLSLGKFGALILILAFGYVIGMIVFNVNFSKIKNWFNNSKNDDLSEVNIKDRKMADSFLSEQDVEPSVRAFLLKNLRRNTAGHFELKVNINAIKANYESHLSVAPVGDVFIAPCLFLKGENSDYIEQQHLPIIKSIFPKSSVKTLEAVGHWLHAEKPELFNQIVLQFIREIS